MEEAIEVRKDWVNEKQRAKFEIGEKIEVII